MPNDNPNLYSTNSAFKELPSKGDNVEFSNQDPGPSPEGFYGRPGHSEPDLQMPKWEGQPEYKESVKPTPNSAPIDDGYEEYIPPKPFSTKELAGIVKYLKAQHDQLDEQHTNLKYSAPTSEQKDHHDILKDRHYDAQKKLFQVLEQNPEAYSEYVKDQKQPFVPTIDIPHGGMHHLDRYVDMNGNCAHCEEALKPENYANGKYVGHEKLNRRFGKSEGLEKGWKEGIAAGAGLAAGMAFGQPKITPTPKPSIEQHSAMHAPQAQGQEGPDTSSQEGNAQSVADPHMHHLFVNAMPKEETKHVDLFAGLHPDLHHIAFLETSHGKNMNHAPSSKGDFYTAYGSLGFKPVSAYEVYSKTKDLKSKFPGLEDKSKFMDNLKKEPKFYNAIASKAWEKLMAHFKDAKKAAYAWRWGAHAANTAAPDDIEGDAYSTQFVNLLNQHKMYKTEELSKANDNPGLYSTNSAFKGLPDKGSNVEFSNQGRGPSPEGYWGQGWRAEEPTESGPELKMPAWEGQSGANSKPNPWDLKSPPPPAPEASEHKQLGPLNNKEKALIMRGLRFEHRKSRAAHQQVLHQSIKNNQSVLHHGNYSNYHTNVINRLGQELEKPELDIHATGEEARSYIDKFPDHHLLNPGQYDSLDAFVDGDGNCKHCEHYLHPEIHQGKPLGHPYIKKSELSKEEGEGALVARLKLNKDDSPLPPVQDTIQRLYDEHKDAYAHHHSLSQWLKKKGADQADQLRHMGSSGDHMLATQNLITMGNQVGIEPFDAHVKAGKNSDLVQKYYKKVATHTGAHPLDNAVKGIGMKGGCKHCNEALMPYAKPPVPDWRPTEETAEDHYALSRSELTKDDNNPGIPKLPSMPKPAQPLSSIKAGAKLPAKEGEAHDYSHLLSPEHIKSGYRMSVTHDKPYTTDNGRVNDVNVELTHNGENIGGIQGAMWHSPEGNKSIEGEYSEINPNHRGGGLGMAAYQALYGHAKNFLGATHAIASHHSTGVRNVHQKLARLHGFTYSPKENVNSSKYPTREAWEKAPAGPFDAKYESFESKI